MRKHLFAVFVLTAVPILLSGCSGTTDNTPPPPSTPPVLTTSSTPTTTTTATVRKDISVNESHALIEANKTNLNFGILDVRTPEEYNAGHIENSLLIDYQAPAFRDEVSNLDKSKTYLVYCRSGRRSAEAADIMVGLGFTDVYNMTGGIIDWEAAGFPVKE